MAAHAAYAAIDMHGMIEKRKVRYLVDFDPIDWLPAFPARSHRGELRIVGLNLRVAVHTGLRRGNIRVGRNIHVRMAVPAVHTELGDMHLVRERHRLNRLIPRSHILRRQVIPVGY